MPFKSQSQIRDRSNLWGHIRKRCLWCRKVYEVACQARMERSKFCSQSCRAKWSVKYSPTHSSKTGVLRKPKGTKNHYKPVICLKCEAMYTPTSSKQRWCKVCCPSRRFRGTMARYNLSKAEYDGLVNRQGGRCALCTKVPIHVDHCHKTLRVRGILCGSCNFKLVGLEDLEWRKRAEVYLAIQKP